jgi:hypothetical protein
LHTLFAFADRLWASSYRLQASVDRLNNDFLLPLSLYRLAHGFYRQALSELIPASSVYGQVMSVYREAFSELIQAQSVYRSAQSLYPQALNQNPRVLFSRL